MLSALGVVDRLNYTLWWRLLWPVNELRKHGYNVDVCRFTELRNRDVDPYDLIITPRLSFAADHWLKGWMRKAHQQGKVWLYDIDDDLTSPDWVDRQVYAVGRDQPRSDRRRLHHVYERQRNERLRVIRRCDGVLASTAVLAERLEGHVEVVPNRIDVAWFQRKARDASRFIPGLTVGWAGGGRLPSDFDPLPAVWAEIARKHPSVTFVVYGAELDTLVDAVPSDRVAIFEWSAIQSYPAVLKNIDIMCCVLPNTLSNSAKSPIKWMEATVSGAACVTSPTVYGEVVSDGHTALVADTEEEWVTAIDRLIAEPALRDHLTRHAFQDVLEHHDLATQWQSWPRAWEEFVQVHSTAT